MKNLFIIVCLTMLAFGCAHLVFDPNHSGQLCELQVHHLSEIPKDILGNLDKMGIDTSLIINEYEGDYFNFIFKVDTQDFNLVGKKVGFLSLTGSKMNYFKDTRSPARNFKTVGASGLYVFDSVQKVESGGYDAAIIYWSKFKLPMEEVIKRLKNK